MSSNWNRLRALLAIVIIGAGLALVAPVPASASGTTITWDGPVDPPVTWEAITFTGQVTPAGATSRVVLQRQVPGGWTDLAGMRPLPDGSFEIAWGTLDRGTYVLRLRSLHGSVVSDTKTIVVAPHPTVITETVHPWRNITVGQKLTVGGQVIEPSATPRVVVQRKVNGKWSDRAAGPVDDSGHFEIPIAPSQVGHYELRVRSNGGSKWSLYPIVFDVSPKPMA